MSRATEATVTTQMYRVYIKATPQAIWDAITQPEWTERYGFGGRAEFELRPRGKFRWLSSAEMRARGGGEVALEGEVLECDPPRKLVQTWRLLMDHDTASEGMTRLTHEIEPLPGGITKLTLTHDLTGAPKHFALVGGELEKTGAGGGWAWVLSDLKTLLETGQGLRG